MPNPKATRARRLRRQEGSVPRHRDLPLHAGGRRAQRGASRPAKSSFSRRSTGATAKRLEGDKRYVIYKVLPFAFQVIKFNHAQPPTNDVNFRLAVQAALDMEEIMAISYPDIYQIDGAWLYPGAAFYTKTGTEKYNQADLNAAKALLAKSGYKGEKLTFIVDNLRANTDTATVVQQRLKEIGVNVELSVADWPTVSKIGFTPKGWQFWAHGFGIEPYEGPASVMAPWVNGTSQLKKDDKIDSLYCRAQRPRWTRASARRSSSSSRSTCTTTRWP